MNGVKANTTVPPLVQGTDGFDRLTLTILDATRFQVDVETFRTSSFAQADRIDLSSRILQRAEGVLLKAGKQDDRIVIHGPVTRLILVRGGAGPTN